MTRSTQLTALLLVAGGLTVAQASARAAQDCHGSVSIPQPSANAFVAAASPEELAAQQQADLARRAARAQAKAARKAARAAAAAKDQPNLAQADYGANGPASCHPQF